MLSPPGFNLYPCLRDDEGNDVRNPCVIKCEARANNRHSSWIAPSSTSSQPATRHGCTISVMAQRGQKSWGHESLLFYTYPLRRARRWPMANRNDYLFLPTFTSASPMLLIKYLLYAEPVLGPGDTEMTKTWSLPLKRFPLGTVRKNVHTNHHTTVQRGQCTQRSPSRCRRCRAESERLCGEEACRGHSKTDFARQTKASKVYREAIYQNLKCMNRELLIAALFGTATNEKQTNWALIGI